MALSRSAYSKIAAVTCILVCLGDFAVTFIIGFMHKGYNFLTQSQSYLGTDKSSVAKYMNAWGVLFSLLFVACAFSLYQTFHVKNKWHIIAVWLIAIYGLGEGLGSGLFPYNHIGDELTLSGKLHSLFSGIGVFALVVLSFVLLKLFSKKLFPKLYRFYLFTAIIGLLLILAFFLSRQDIIPLRGLWQRLFLLDYYLMLIVLTLHQVKANRSSGSGSHYLV